MAQNNQTYNNGYNGFRDFDAGFRHSDCAVFYTGQIGDELDCFQRKARTR
jgi:hypothetical protein